MYCNVGSSDHVIQNPGKILILIKNSKYMYMWMYNYKLFSINYKKQTCTPDKQYRSDHRYERINMAFKYIFL